MVILEPALVAVRRDIERDMGVLGFGLALQQDVAADVHGDVGAVEVSLPGKHDGCLDWVAEIPGRGDIQSLRYVAAQRIAHVTSPAFDGEQVGRASCRESVCQYG